MYDSEKLVSNVRNLLDSMSDEEFMAVLEESGFELVPSDSSGIDTMSEEDLFLLFNSLW